METSKQVRPTGFFSPYHYSNPGMILEDSFLLQGNTIDSLNMTRIKNLKNKGINKQIFPFKQGNFVLLKLDLPTEQGSKSNVTPKFRDVWKITEILKGGFGMTLINLRSRVLTKNANSSHCET